MRVAITGASGNVGTSVLTALGDEPDIDDILAIARRPAEFSDPRVRFVAADVVQDDLATLFAGVDAVVHLAWLIQPSRDRTLRAVNVDGSRRVFEACAQAGVRSLVHASSVGAYSPGPKDRAVDESWPTEGIPSLFYSRHKVEVERILDEFERQHPAVRVVRLRPALIFKREAATGIRRLFAGPLLPTPLLRLFGVPVVPDAARFRFQAVHSLDVGDAYRRRSCPTLAERSTSLPTPCWMGRPRADLGARRVPVRAGVLRRAADVRGGCGFSRRLPAGSTWRSGFRSWMPVGRSGSSAGRRERARRMPSRSSSTGSVPAWTFRRRRSRQKRRRPFDWMSCARA